MRAAFGCVLGFALACGLVGFATGQGKLDTKKLVGKWEPADAKKIPPMMVEFTGDGKLYLTVSEAKLEGTYKVTGDKLDIAFKGDEIKDTLTIKKLDDNELTTEDSKGKSETLKRKK